MGGRIEFANLSEEEKHPIILPSKSYVVKLIIADVHRRQLHAGINQTLISLRDKYWIIRARQVVRTVVKSCFICRKLKKRKTTMLYYDFEGFGNGEGR